MRLFAALDLNDDARRAIAVEQQRLLEELRGAGHAPRLVSPERMHVTLVFLGEVSDAPGAAVVDAMSEDVGVAPFTMAFAGLGVFPPRGAPSVLWLGVAAGRRDVLTVQELVAARLARVGAVDRDSGTRAYHPHLTLGRWRGAKAAAGRRAVAADRGAEIAGVEVTAVTLYQSRLSSSGPHYTALASARLHS
jgi:2'-5' RNA ligase